MLPQTTNQRSTMASSTTVYAHYDVVVVGGGLAACEAAHAAARLGCRVLLIAERLERLATISDNARIGGPARGILIREVDALGGLSGRAADASLLHIRLVNQARGPAHWALRAAVDDALFSHTIRQMLQNTLGLTLLRGVVTAVVPPGISDTHWTIMLPDAPACTARAVVLALGRSVRQRIHIGPESWNGAPACDTLGEQIGHLVPLTRYHIAYPPIVDRETLSVANAEVLPGSTTPLSFAHDGLPPSAPPPDARLPIYRSHIQPGWRDQIPSYRIHTTPATNALIAAAWSPLRLGSVGTGPVGCDPVELLVTRCPERAHPLILEPMSWSSSGVYLRGAYTAIAAADQERMLATLPGMERIRMLRPGMLVEYDGLAAHSLGPDLSLRRYAGLYAGGVFAGANGNEEAAALGLMAGINAARYVLQQPPVIIDRKAAYLGVLVDDVANGVGLPYRMLKARIANRTHLRSDNADLRLTPFAGQFGLVDAARVAEVERKREQVEALLAELHGRRVFPSIATNRRLVMAGIEPLSKETTAERLLRRQTVSYGQLQQALDLPVVPPQVATLVEVAMRYQGYAGRAQEARSHAATERSC